MSGLTTSSFPTILLPGFIGPKISEIEFGQNVLLYTFSWPKHPWPKRQWSRRPTFRLDSSIGYGKNSGYQHFSFPDIVFQKDFSPRFIETLYCLVNGPMLNLFLYI